ncbi:MAG: lipopolysaccharide biosynthesis protein RfbH [archaeon]
MRNITLKNKMKKLVKEYYKIEAQKNKKSEFISVTGKKYDDKELWNGIEAILKGWWTEGEYNLAFENKLKEYVGCKYAVTTNSGSSANLLAFMSLTSKKLGEKRILPGDEVITVAACFPTTVFPIIQAEAVPVFVDVDLETYNAKVDEIKKAISPKTKAILMAHTLGNPFQLDEILKIKEKYDLWLIEDTCDALGSTYAEKKVGSFGDLSTFSFYPAHHITTIEGGAILTNNSLIHRIVRSFRDWGRDCWCSTGKNDTCGKRFGWQLGKLPFGYDHKYIYSEIGYNLKMTDIQAAIGLAQLEKIEKFSAIRKKNFNYLKSRMIELGLDEYFILPKQTPKSDPCWFGFILTIKDKYADLIRRNELQQYLYNNKIDSRVLFAGNITKQPVFIENEINYKVVGNLSNTDRIMKNSLWVGIHQGLNKKHMEKIAKNIANFIYDKMRGIK